MVLLDLPLAQGKHVFSTCNNHVAIFGLPLTTQGKHVFSTCVCISLPFCSSIQRIRPHHSGRRGGARIRIFGRQRNQRSHRVDREGHSRWEKIQTLFKLSLTILCNEDAGDSVFGSSSTSKQTKSATSDEGWAAFTADGRPKPPR